MNDLIDMYEGRAAGHTYRRSGDGFEKVSFRQSSRPLHAIAQAVRDDWGNVSPAAVPHLDALSVLESADDTYGTDSARTIVSRFLANSTDWRGKTAHQIKGELKAL